MGQLIKLQDYISRYEQDIFTYPSRFVRLKKQQWDRVKADWESEDGDESNLFLYQPVMNWGETEEEKETSNLMKKFIGLLNPRYQKHTELEQQGALFPPKLEEPMEFSASFQNKPDHAEDLKRQFLDQLYRFQLKWASSTLAEMSSFHSKYYFDEHLKFFLQRFPDTFLVLYKPIFLLKNAPVEAEIILLTPTDVWCITFLEQEDSAVFIGSSERFWLKRSKMEEKKVLNPLLALNRTGRIVRNIFKMYEIELPIHKLIISRNGYIDYPSAPLDTEFLEARNFKQWSASMRTQKSPLKHAQLKGAKVLLQYCLTQSIRRPEWENHEENE